jgi:hypothetical protein
MMARSLFRSVKLGSLEHFGHRKGFQMSGFLDKANDMTDTVRDKIEDKPSDGVSNQANTVEELSESATFTEESPPDL